MAKYLGRGDPEMARKSAFRSIRVVGVLTGTVAFIFYLLRGRISTWFADDEKIVELVYDTLPIILYGLFAEGFGCVANYTIAGQGRFWILTVTALVQSVIVTIPLSALMVFGLGFGVQGIASSLIVGYLTTGIILLSIVLISDWEKIAREHSTFEKSSSHVSSFCDE